MKSTASSPRVLASRRPPRTRRTRDHRHRGPDGRRSSRATRPPAQPTTTLDLANIVQSAAKGVTTVQEAPAIVTVITADEIRDRQFQDLTSSSTTRCRAGRARPRTQHVPDRRSCAGRCQAVQFLHDGVSLFDPFVNVPTRSRVQPIELIKRVEMITGPGGVLWGSNSLLGILNVITKDAEDVDGVEVGGQLGDGRGDRHDGARVRDGRQDRPARRQAQGVRRTAASRPTRARRRVPAAAVPRRAAAAELARTSTARSTETDQAAVADRQPLRQADVRQAPAARRRARSASATTRPASPVTRAARTLPEDVALPDGRDRSGLRRSAAAAAATTAATRSIATRSPSTARGSPTTRPASRRAAT